jgi:hypothetical protein
MPVNSILRGFEGPTWNLALTACKHDDASLIDQAITSCTPEEDPEGLLRYATRHAIQNNAEKVLTHLITHHTLNLATLRPSIVAGPNRSIAILQLLLDHGWDINFREPTSSNSDAEPFLWHVVGDADVVAWCLAHGASVVPSHMEKVRPNELTLDQYRCGSFLERAAASASPATFELLRSKGAPLGWRPLHLAVESAAIAAGPDDEEGKASKGTERMEMVKHLIDVVGIDVNALDHPVGTHHPRRLGPPICYVASLEGLMYTRRVTWLLLERGADPRPGLEEAERSGHETFKGDVEAWRERGGDGGGDGGESKGDGGRCGVQ